MDDFHAFYDAGDDACQAYVEAWTTEPIRVKRIRPVVKQSVYVAHYKSIFDRLIVWLIPPAFAPPRAA